MTPLLLPRRKFLVGAAAFIAAPAIVRASSLMPISVQRELPDHDLFRYAARTFAPCFAVIGGELWEWEGLTWYGPEDPITGLRP